jgi:hypothetical protein
MKKRTKKATRYPDISDLLSMKEKGRRARAKLSLGEKIERMERLRERLRPLKEAREERRRKTGSTAIG